MSTATAEKLEQDRPAVEPGAPTAPDEPDTTTEPDTTDEPDTDEQPATDPERPRVDASEPTRGQLRSLDAERERHLGEVRDIMGEFVAGMVDCEHCNGLGLAPAGPTPQTHPWFQTCDTCKGYGQVLTGSLREGQEGTDCPQCGGRGYLEALDAQGTPLRELAAQPTAPAGAELYQVTGPGAPAGEGEAVSFGRPGWMGDPNIGH